MTTDIDCFVQREKAIRGKVNILEGLHKTCQLSAIGLSEPILNESRYLARALADLLYFERGTPYYLTALQNAEHAIRCAVNDAVDILISFVKASLVRIEKDYSKYSLALSPFGEQYVAALTAMEMIGGKVVASRRTREERDAIYCELAENNPELEAISEFALKLPRIESLASQVHNDLVSAIALDGQGSHWIAEKIVEALGNESGSSSLSIFIQPKYEVASDGNFLCIGAEALARLDVNEKSISPAVFIPVAEQTGLISEIGLFAIRWALAVLKERKELQSISVNVSPSELLDSEYSSKVIKLIEWELGAAGGRLELEITESAAINDLESFHHIEKLAEAGVRIAIDDFGTGQTKFDDLAKAKISVLKIDQSLVRAYNRAPKTYKKLLHAIEAIGRKCELEIIAEGVENGDEVAALHENIGLTKFQGWHFGKAVSATDFFQAHTAFKL